MNIAGKIALAAGALVLSSPSSGGQSPSPPPSEDSAEDLAFERDKTERMTVPVSIGGRGPYRFLVDTGAERTVIAQELARELSLTPGAAARLHSMTEVGNVETVIIPRLNVNTRTVKGINAPALSRKDLGAEGMLGVDSLQSQRVLFDFENGTLSISRSTKDEARWDGHTVLVTARSRFGHLILADARIDGQKVWVIIDTGSQVSIGNDVLRRKLEARKKLGATTPVELVSVTGGTMTADYTKAKNLVVGGLTLTDMPIAFANVHPFKKLGLTNKPAMLLGMDALKAFSKVSVDFANRRVRFLLPEQSGIQPNSRMAAVEAERAPRL